MAKKNKHMWAYMIPIVFVVLVFAANYFGLISDDVFKDPMR
tara:strand:+ start:518 stop:640 length:123 start_codon:yes stop_codon:yes gene_type:complete